MHTILQILFQLVPPLLSHRLGHRQIILRWEGRQAISKDPPELEDAENTGKVSRSLTGG